MTNNNQSKRKGAHRLWALFLTLMLFSHGLSAQDFTIRGRVTDQIDGSTLPGVNIVEKGTVRGTVTGIDGTYTLTVSGPNVILRFSYIGYMEEEVAVNNRNEINVSMSLSIEMLTEMVVIGYGVQRKDDLTGSVAIVNAEDLQRMNPVSFDAALQGRAPGVHVASTSGRPGAGASIKIRGIGSISRSSEPLYVVDGLALSSGGINAISPADIESIQVLKDASATAIYGTRGANGVIVITTRRGEKGKPVVNYSTNMTLNQIPRTFDVMNADQYSQFMQQSWANRSQRENIADANNFYLTTYSPEARLAKNNFDTSTDWQSAISQQSMGQNHSLSVRGGSDNSNYFISGSYFAEDGILVNTGMDRISLRANADFQVSDRFRIGQSISLSHINYIYESHKINFNPWFGALVASPLMHLYDTTAVGGYGGPVFELAGANERTNVVAEQMLNDNTQTVNRMIANAYAELDLFKGLKYSVRLGGEYDNSHSFQWSPVYRLGDQRLRDNDIATLQETSGANQIWQLGNFLEYSNRIGGHNFSTLLGYERTREYGNWMLASGRNLPFNEFNVLNQVLDGERVNGSRDEERLESVLFRGLYDYNGRYLVTASVRRDGSSKFSPANRIGYFPSFSLGWRMNEDLFPNFEPIEMMKLRFGWGQTGNSNLGRHRFYELMDPFQNSRYNFGRNQDLYLGAAAITSQSSPLIQWEASEMTNIGVDVTMLNAKIQFSAEYYIKNQDNMLVEKPISSVFGKRIQWGGAQIIGAWMNLARVQNSGLELNLLYRQFDKPFKYAINANFSTVKNKIVDLGVGEFVAGNYHISRNGHTIGSFFGYVAERIFTEDDFLKDENGNLIKNAQGNFTLLHARQEVGTSPGDLKFKDLNNDGIINDLDRTIIGKPLPDFIYGLDIQLNYRNWDMNIFFNGMQNISVYNEMYSRIGVGTDVFAKDENKLVEVLNSWTPENPSTTMTRAYPQDPNRNSRASTWFLEDASFLRVRTAQIGYTLPRNISSRVGIGQFRVYIGGNNLFTFTSYRGYDPEVSSQNPLMMGVDGGFYPVPRTFMMGIQVGL